MNPTPRHPHIVLINALLAVWVFSLLCMSSSPRFTTGSLLASTDVGVIPAQPGVCPSGSEYVTIYMDDEDDDNASSLSGWVGAFSHRVTDHINGTTLGFCRVDGSQFYNLGHYSLINWETVPYDPTKASVGAYSYAVLRLGDACPNSSKEHVRHIDNEDDDNLNESSNNIAPNTTSRSDDETFLYFCLFTPSTGTSMTRFPNIGISYGVFAGKVVPPNGPGHNKYWVETGAAHTDDEDSFNDNYSVTPGFDNDDIFDAAAGVTIGDDDTTFYLSRVFPCDVSITSQPASVIFPNGGVLTFSVGVSGVSPFTYKWRKNGTILSDGPAAGGGTITGSAASTVTISPASSPADDGLYDVVVTSSCGEMRTSSTAGACGTGPVITSQPVSKITTIGSSASFTVVATANEPITYVWCRPDLAICLTDGGNISGSGTPTLTISPVMASNVGTYFVDVSTTCGSVLSNTVTLSLGIPDLSPVGVYTLATSLLLISLIWLMRRKVGR